MTIRHTYLLLLVFLSALSSQLSANETIVSTPAETPVSGAIPLGNGTRWIAGKITAGTNTTVTIDGTNVVISATAAGGDYIAQTDGTWEGTLTGEDLTGQVITAGAFFSSTPFTGDELPNALVRKDYVEELTPAIAETIDDLLAADVYDLSRWAYLTTPGEFWVYCPDETTADNADDIRRPDSIVSDATPGRWARIDLASGGGSGTVTSVALTVPSFLSVSGSPITSSGTLAVSLSGTALPVANGGSGATTLTGYLKGNGTSAFTAASTVPWSDIASTPTTLSGYGISDGITAAAVAAGYQPLDSDLTAIAALTTTSFGRGLLDDADAAAGRTTLGVVIGSNVQAYDADLTTYAGITPSANVQTLLGAANYAAFKTSLSLNNVENTALSTWAGSANITTLGTISSGTVPVARVSGLATIATSGSASDLGTGTLPDARFPATLPASSGANLTALNASNLGSGTVPDARFPATLPAASGVNLTSLNASNLGSGTVPTARLGSGTADSTTFLRGDNTWATPAGGGGGGWTTGILFTGGSTTAVIDNSAAETSVFSGTIPGGTLGTTNAVRVILTGQILQDVGSGQGFTLRVKFGATTLYADASNATIFGSNANRRTWRMEFTLFADGSTSAQRLDGLVGPFGAAAAATTGIGDLAGSVGLAAVPIGGSSTEDSTSDQTLDITIQLTTANNSYEWYTLKGLAFKL